jgi:hypothetical protein
MALNDGSLQDAGRNYYESQFGGRVQNIRKYGATPPSSSRGCLGAGAGGGVVALLVVIRIIIALAVGSQSYDSSYNTYTPPPINYDPPPQVEFNKDPQPWQLNQDDPAQRFNPWADPKQEVQPDNPPFVVPDNPRPVEPDLPPASPGNGDKDE